MKKKYTQFFLFFLFFIPPLSSENSALNKYLKEGCVFKENKRINLKMGYEGFFVVDERLKQRRKTRGRIDTFKQVANSGLILLNFYKNLDVYSTLGAAKIKADWRIRPPSGVVTRVEFQTQTSFLWSIGANGIVWEDDLTAIAVGVRYFYIRPKLSWLTSNGAPIDVKNDKLNDQKWQANVIVSHQIGIFVPYLGFQYSDLRASLKNVNAVVASNGSGTIHMNRRDLVGFFVGTSITNGKILAINLESHFVDEEASIISAIFRF